MRVRILLLVAVWVCSLAVATGQETTGTITGFVKDKTGAVVPGVEVVVRNTDQGFERRVVAGDGGEYTATLLPIGAYEVVVEKQGFKRFAATGIKLSVNDRLRVDVTLELGAMAETIAVEAVVPQIQNESAEVGGVITGRKVLEMPLNGRSLLQLVALQPGVSSGSGIASGRVGVGLDNLASVNVNGARAAQNNWLLDGGDNVDTGSNLGLINFISVDSVAEFRILRGNYNAEFGRSGGGQINVVTKSGANSFHGGAFEFWRNDAMDAVNAFSRLDRTGDGKPDPALLRYHNFGYNVGGPVFKDKVFFYFNQEFRKVRTVRGAGLVRTRVATDAQWRGDFSAFNPNPSSCTDPGAICDPQTGSPFPNNMIPSGRLDARAVALRDLFPRPNSAPPLNFSAAAPSGRNYREELIRVDWNLSPAHKLFGRYVHDAIPSTEPFGEVFGTNNAAFPGVADTKTNIPARNLVTEWTWVPSSRMVNNLAFNYSFGGIFSDITGRGLRRNFSGFNGPEVFPVNPAGALPGILFTGVTFGGASLYGGFNFFGPYDNTYGSRRIKDTFSIVWGKHTFKGGYLYSWEFKNENAASGTNGSFTFPGTTAGGTFITTNDAFADFLLGRASSYSEADIDITSNLRYDMHEAFLQDDWKALPNLTFNLGVRWSYILPPTDKNNLLTNFDPARFNLSRAYQIETMGPMAGRRIAGTGDPLNGIYRAGVDSPFGRRIVASHADTIGPRFGFAWDPFKTGKTAIRGGYGMYFDRTLSGIALQNAFVNPPFVISAQFLAAEPAVPTLANPSGGAQTNQETIVPTLISMSPNFLVPTTQHWSFGVQRELWWNLAMDISYVGNHATHLLREVRINQTPVGTVAPAAASAPFRGYGLIRERQTSASSRYDSLQVGVNKRFSKGLQFDLAYTFSKVMTDSPDDRSTVPQDVRNLRVERARASFDKAHIFVFSWTYELPFFKNARSLLYNTLGGWQVGGIYRAESGLPQSVFISPNQARSFFGGSQRPNRVGNPEGQRTVDRWFNTAVFALPTQDTFGNAGRSLFDGPGINLWDLSLFKNFRVTEQIRMQFRAEFFNAFNHVNYLGVSTTVGAPNFGQLTSALGPREIQLGLKVNF